MIRQPQDSLGFLMWQVTHGWQRHLEEALAPTGLTHLQFVVLMGTRWHAGLGVSITQAELARWAQMHPMQVSQVVKLLSAKGLLRRIRSSSDARASHIELTATGLRVAATAAPIADAAHHGFFADAPQIEEPLRRLFDRVAGRRSC